eukprot:Nk52_evm23s358 gene=Nk52_evmTU23s358
MEEINEYPSKPSGAMSRRKKIILIVAAVCVVVGVGLALGLYFGLKDSGNSSPHSSNVTSTATATVTAPASSSSTALPTSSETPSTSFIPTSSSSVTTPTTAIPTTTETPTTTTASAVTPTSSVAPTTAPPVDTLPQCPPGQRIVSTLPGNIGGYTCESGDYSTAEGAQMLMPTFGDQHCVARPDVPPGIIDIILAQFPETNWHDIADRTGIFSRESTQYKSYSFSSVAGDACVLKGYIKDGKTFVKDDRYPTLVHKSASVGPLVWPDTKMVPIGEEICPVGKECCIAAQPNLQNGPYNYYGSWSDFAVSYQRLCSPVYTTTSCDANQLECNGETGDGDLQKNCNCIVCSNGDAQQCAGWSGAGANCLDTSPGGKYDGQYDLFMSFSYELNKHFQATGECGGNNVAYAKKCTSTSSSPCMVASNPAVKVSYSGWNFGGKS